MAWLRVGDNINTHPLMSRLVEACEYDHALKNEALGLFIAMATSSAAHLTDYAAATVAALGYTAHASWTNFVLFGGVDDPAATWKALYDRGVLIRDVGIAHHLRVTAGTADETTAFLDALASVGSRA